MYENVERTEAEPTEVHLEESEPEERAVALDYSRTLATQIVFANSVFSCSVMV